MSPKENPLWKLSQKESLFGKCIRRKLSLETALEGNLIWKLHQKETLFGNYIRRKPSLETVLVLCMRDCHPCTRPLASCKAASLMCARQLALCGLIFLNLNFSTTTIVSILQVKIVHRLSILVHLIILLHIIISSQPMLAETLAMSEWKMMVHVRSLVLVISF